MRPPGGRGPVAGVFMYALGAASRVEVRKEADPDGCVVRDGAVTGWLIPGRIRAVAWRSPGDSLYIGPHQHGDGYTVALGGGRACPNGPDGSASSDVAGAIARGRRDLSVRGYADPIVGATGHDRAKGAAFLVPGVGE